MTTCVDYETLLHGLVDDELDAANTFACEQHLAGCEQCKAELHSIERLRQKLRALPLAYPASGHLRDGINATLDAKRRAGSASSRIMAMFNAIRQQAWPAAVLTLTAVLALVVFLPPQHDELVDQIVAGHVRSLQVAHLVDVETSDRHVVKPWFAGKINFSPPVVDLADKDFALIGGRLDYLQNHAVAALAYRRRAHTINLFLWPSTSNSAPASQSANGFNLIHWQAGSMSYWAVSDINARELREFQQDLAARVE